MSAGDRPARGFTVREALPADIDAVVALERATEHAPRWQREMYEEIVRSVDPSVPTADVRRHLVLAKGEDGQVVGFAVGSVHLALPDLAVLESVGVAAAARRAGAGRALCEAIIEWCRRHDAAQIGLEVRGQSAGAIALYTRLGFAETGRRRGYYADPMDDAIILRMELTGS